MTTESRMREALKKAYNHLGSLACTHPHLSAPTLRQEISEALSPPARRTSYEFQGPGESTILVHWDGRKWCARYEPHNYVAVDREFLCAAIATLANLTKPEEKA